MNSFLNIISPLDQFEIRDLISLNAPILGNLSFSLTNIGLYLTLGESIYATVHNIVTSQINEKKGQIYFPFIYVLFVFILINNLIGMVPYSFASTSHFVLTFSLSFTVVLGATILGLSKHGLEFFSLFVPAGCPLGLLPLLVLIEFISYLARNVSLGLRLAANILSGLFPLAFIIAFSGLELGIAFIQAQVFVVLSCSYIKDALELH
ncbi:ATP synthase F0 subunit 6 [Handroanthus impetiginosus]|uniref:F-ATPase protein 6 n=1 Tax=Handroanthus impetiginosus TaxID=429701 RepID=A0A2G9FVA1_9LAMI|nr:ATP synthase F0 subunit 6 [Handroanthus impetiginosus]